MTEQDTRGLREIAAECTKDAIAALRQIMLDDEVAATVRVAAAKELLDRAHGKVGAAVEPAPAEEAGDREITVRFVDVEPGSELTL